MSAPQNAARRLRALAARTGLDGIAEEMLAIALDLESATTALTLHDEFTVIRLRRVCKLLGLETAVPQVDGNLLACLSPVLGLMARKLEDSILTPKPHTAPSDDAPLAAMGPCGK